VRALNNPPPFAVYLWVPAFARTTVDKGGPALDCGQLQQITSKLPPSSSRKRGPITRSHTAAFPPKEEESIIVRALEDPHPLQCTYGSPRSRGRRWIRGVRRSNADYYRKSRAVVPANAIQAFEGRLCAGTTLQYLTVMDHYYCVTLKSSTVIPAQAGIQR
jgi:hypothetical protein